MPLHFVPGHTKFASSQVLPQKQKPLEQSAAAGAAADAAMPQAPGPGQQEGAPLFSPPATRRAAAATSSAVETTAPQPPKPAQQPSGHGYNPFEAAASPSESRYPRASGALQQHGHARPGGQSRVHVRRINLREHVSDRS